MTTFSDMLYHLGGAPVDMTVPPGAKAFYVHSGTGSDGNTGETPDAPLATADYAVGKLRASRGDTIICLPGHAENLATATALVLDVAGIRLIGLGEGNLIPTFSTTAAAGTISVTAANVTIANIRLTANFATGTTAGITVAATATGLTLRDVQFRDTAATSEFLVHVSVAAAVTDLLISRCSFVTLAGSLTNSVLFAGASTDCTIEDSYFFVDSADDVIDHLAGASVNLVVRRNIIINADTGAAGYCVRYKSDGTGTVYDNRFAYNKVDAEIGIGAAAWWLENYASNTIAESGRLDPTTSHAIP